MTWLILLFKDEKLLELVKPSYWKFRFENFQNLNLSSKAPMLLNVKVLFTQSVIRIIPSLNWCSIRERFQEGRVFCLVLIFIRYLIYYTVCLTKFELYLTSLEQARKFIWIHKIPSIEGNFLHFRQFLVFTQAAKKTSDYPK